MTVPVTTSLRKFCTNAFGGAAGALITLLIISQWQQMATNSSEARKEVATLRGEITAKHQSFDAQISVLVDRQAKLESYNNTPAPVVGEETTLENFEDKKEQIQKQIDKEVYRAETRSK